jgi:6-phosphogluconolactonase
MLKKAAALFLVGASLATWLGCTTNSSTYLYAAIPGSNQIVVYREDPNSGILTVLVGSPITAGNGVQSIVIHPSKKFLYAANSGENDVSQFAIATDGALTEVTTTIVGTAPNLLAMDSAGSFLYVSNLGSNTISVFSIDASSGALTPVAAPFSIGGTALNMKLSPSGNVLYVTVAGNPGFIEAFSMNAGVPSVITNSPFQAGANPYGLAIDPSGTHLYTANTGDNSISAFTIANGSLTPISGPLGETYSAPLALFVDNSGKYLYVANEGSSNLAAYGIGSDGGLTLLTNSPFVTGTQPSFITSDSTGKYLFVGNQSSPAIQSFSLDGSTGTLTSVRSFPVGSTPTSIALTP